MAASPRVTRGGGEWKPSAVVDDDDEDDEEGQGRSLRGAKYRSRPRSRRELPAHAVCILKAWLVSPDHFDHPYPTASEQTRLMVETGIDKKQLKNWFTNARRRIWKPLVQRNGPGLPSQHGSSMMQHDDFSSSSDRNGENRGAVETYDDRDRMQQQQQQQQQEEEEAPLRKWSSSFGTMKRSSFGSMSAFLDPSLGRSQLGSTSFLDFFVDETATPEDPKLTDTMTTEPFLDDSSEQSRSISDHTSSNQAPSEQSSAVDCPLDERQRGVCVSPVASCAFCAHAQVDTLLVPCRHVFHGHCLRPWLEATITTPSCPICSVAIANCVLATVVAETI